MGKSLVTIIFLLIIGNYLSRGQDSLCVFKSKGIVLLASKNTKIPLTKGNFIKPKGKLSVLEKSEITLIDANGHLYFIEKKGTFSFQQVLKHEKTQQKANLTLDYFKYVWNELVENNTKKALIAGVFRGNVLMKFPRDSSKIYNSKITFTWDLLKNEKLYYVFVKNMKTDKILKMQTNGSQLALFDDNPIFEGGDSFSWTVSNDEFPNVKNLVFHTFTVINREAYEENKLFFADFINDLKQIGTTETEIETILCGRFLLCK
jgi:hypothetical protein